MSPVKSEAKTIFFFERGIMGWKTLFGGWFNWPNQAVSWIHRHTGCRAQTLLYFVDALFAGLTRERRAKWFRDMLSQYPDSEGWEIHICAHSEGTATVLESLRLACWPKIKALHLVSGACDGDFERNGLNHALEHGRISEVFVYVAGKDAAMKLEDTIIGHWCFGIRMKDKPLGLTGPINMREHLMSQVIEIYEPTFGHSDWFTRSNFNKTMGRFAA